jgi:hypothetical protein
MFFKKPVLQQQLNNTGSSNFNKVFKHYYHSFPFVKLPTAHGMQQPMAKDISDRNCILSKQ